MAPVKKKRNQVTVENTILTEYKTTSKQQCDSLKMESTSKNKYLKQFKEATAAVSTSLNNQKLNTNPTPRLSILPKAANPKQETMTKKNLSNFHIIADSNATLTIQKSQTLEKKQKKAKKVKKVKKASINNGEEQTLDDYSNRNEIEKTQAKNLNDEEERKASESIRWENQVENPDEEAKRIELYKMNRRKRYMEERNRSQYVTSFVDKQSNDGDNETSSNQNQEASNKIMTLNREGSSSLRISTSVRLLKSRNMVDIDFGLENIRLDADSHSIDKTIESISSLKNVKKQRDSAISSMSSNSNR